MEEKIFIKNAKGLKLASIIHYPNKNKKYPKLIETVNEKILNSVKRYL